MATSSFFEKLLVTNGSIDIPRIERIWESMELKNSYHSPKRSDDINYALNIITFLESRNAPEKIEYTIKLLAALPRERAANHLDKLACLESNTLSIIAKDSRQKNKVRASAVAIGLLDVPKDMSQKLNDQNTTPASWLDAFRYVAEHIKNKNPNVQQWLSRHPDMFKRIVKGTFTEDIGIAFQGDTTRHASTRDLFAFHVSQILVPIIREWDTKDKDQLQEWETTLSSVKWKNTFLGNVAAYWIQCHEHELNNPYIQALFVALFKKDPAPTLYDAPKVIETLWYNHDFSWLPQPIIEKWAASMVEKTEIDTNAPQSIVKKAIAKQLKKAEGCTTPQAWVWTEVLTHPERVDLIQEDSIIRILKPWQKKSAESEFKIENIDIFLNAVAQKNIPLSNIHHKLVTFPVLSQQLAYLLIDTKERALNKSTRHPNPWVEIEKIKNIVNYVQELNPDLDLERTIHTLTDVHLTNSKQNNIAEVSYAIDTLWSGIFHQYPSLSNLESIFNNLASAGLANSRSKLEKREFVVQQLHNYRSPDSLESKKDILEDIMNVL